MIRYLILIAALLFATVASAQTPAPHPDVDLRKVAGVYPVKCQDSGNADIAELCFARVDGPVVSELGCEPVAMDGIVDTTIEVAPTPQVNAEIRCYAVDDEGLVSEYSANKGTIDFTAPRAPRFIAWLKSPPRYGACNAPVFDFDA